MSAGDTPRTDAVEKTALEQYQNMREAGWPPMVSDGFDFARTLERELTVAQAEVEHWKQRATDISTATESTVEGLRAQLAAANAELAGATVIESNLQDRLRKARERFAAANERAERLSQTDKTYESAILAMQMSTFAADLRATGAVEALERYTKGPYNFEAINALSALTALLAKLEGKTP